MKKSRTLISSPVSEGSLSPQIESSERLNTSSLRLIHSAKQSSRSTGRKPRSTETSTSLLPTPKAGSNTNWQWNGSRTKKSVPLSRRISSPEDFPASHSLKLDEEKERQMTVTSGRQCLSASLFIVHDGSSLKMLRDSLLGTRAWFSRQCVLTWKRKDTKYSRLLYQLAPSARHIGEIGSGLLPTARAGNPGSRPNKKGGKILAEEISKMLPTPRAKDYEGGVEYAPGGIITRKNGVRHGAKIKDVLGTETGLKLHPNFVEWMMGFPEGWTEIPDSKLLEMRLSRKLRKKSLEQ